MLYRVIDNVGQNLTGTCNADCMCDDLRYDPVCSHELVRYYSPCHAGCSWNNVTDGNDTKVITENTELSFIYFYYH